jgi:hypothetical protein
MVTSGMIEKDERVIWVEDESVNDMPESSLMKIMKV